MKTIKKMKKEKACLLFIVILAICYWVNIAWNKTSSTQRSLGCNNLDTEIASILNLDKQKDNECNDLRNGFSIVKGFSFNGLEFTKKKQPVDKYMTLAYISSQQKEITYGKHTIYVTYFLTSGDYDDNMAIISSVIATFYVKVNDYYISGMTGTQQLKRNYQDIEYVPKQDIEKVNKYIVTLIDENLKLN